MDEKQRLIKNLEWEIAWASYRMKILDIIEEKLFEMKSIALGAAEGYTPAEEKEANKRLKCLSEEINALNIESQRDYK